MFWFRRRHESSDLGAVLVIMGALDAQELQAALQKQSAPQGVRKPDERLGSILVALGYITPEQLALALSFQRRMRKGSAAEVMAEIVEARSKVVLTSFPPHLLRPKEV